MNLVQRHCGAAGADKDDAVGVFDATEEVPLLVVPARSSQRQSKRRPRTLVPGKSAADADKDGAAGALDSTGGPARSFQRKYRPLVPGKSPVDDSDALSAPKLGDSRDIKREDNPHRPQAWFSPQRSLHRHVGAYPPPPSAAPVSPLRTRPGFVPWVRIKEPPSSSSVALHPAFSVPPPPPPAPEQNNQVDVTSSTPPPPSAATETSGAPLPSSTDDDDKGLIPQLGFAGAVLVSLSGGLKDLMSGWNGAVRMAFVGSLMLGTFCLGSGLMGISSVVPTSYTRKVASFCSRVCTCMGTFVLMVNISFHLGSKGYIAGIISGLMAVGYMMFVWVKGVPGAQNALNKVKSKIRKLWRHCKESRQRGPILG